MTNAMFRIYSFIYEKFLLAQGSVLNSMYRLGLVDTLVTHANMKRAWPNSLVRRPPWLYASSVKNKTNTCPPGFSDLPTALDVTTKLEESHNATCIPRDPTNAKAIYHCSNTINFKPQNEMWESDLFLFYLPTAVFIDSMALLSYVLSEPVCMYFEMKC